MPPRSKKARVALSYEPPIADYRTALTFFVNGNPYELANVDINMSMLEWLRANGYTGTKLGCGEGGCGACTVMVSSYEAGAVRHAAVNAWCAPK